MAADTRPFKSKEQDGQGNEVIIRDQQLVEQASQTTMASGEYFEIVDVDGRMAKIPKANMMSVVLEAIRLLLDDSGSNISAANLTKILGLSASSIGNILPADLASVLGGFKLVDYRSLPTSSQSEGDLDQIEKSPHSYGFRAGWCNSSNIPSIGITEYYAYCIDFNMAAQIIIEYRGNKRVILRFRNDVRWETVTVTGT